MILIFASCKDENAFMYVDDDQPCYTILVSTPGSSDTRATYSEFGDSIAVEWEKGDVLYVGNNEFVFKEMQGNNGLFYHYGSIENAGSWTGTVKFGQDKRVNSQFQKKNRSCREHLVAEVKTAIDLESNPTISLLPTDDMSVLHVQLKSPAMLLGGSMMKINGLEKNRIYSVTLGDDPMHVFVDKGDVLDVYVAIQANKSISGTIKFYFYAYDEKTGTAESGDEYHYYMKCSDAIITKSNEVIKMPLPNKPTYTAIQLGLPSGTKWATMNLGATKASEVGNYYAWGEVETKSNYSTSNSITLDKTPSMLSEMFDKQSNLNYSYDAATENWGESWRIPTYAQAEELCNCTWKKAIMDGVNGYNVTNGNKSIFMPVTGYMNNATLTDGDVGYYWVSTLIDYNVDNANKVAYSLYFGDRGRVSKGGLRSSGRAIRPVLGDASVADIGGEFTVGPGKKIKFSKGNLQYQASTGTWRFAENQYDVCGLDNNNISPTYSGWIDLFGWGTSGWNSKAVAYQPYSTSTNNNDYKVGNATNKNLVGDCANADWGVYNTISNGGYPQAMWRVFTKNEADSLVNKRTNAANLRTKAIVNGVPGVLLFPDNWVTPSDIIIIMDVKNNFNANIYSKEDFEYLEFLGAIFLPAGGYRKGNVTDQLGIADSETDIDYDTNSYDNRKITGSYWTSSYNKGTSAYCVCFKNKNNDANFYNNVIYAPANCDRMGGCCVRLVHDVK